MAWLSQVGRGLFEYGLAKMEKAWPKRVLGGYVVNSLACLKMGFGFETVESGSAFFF